MPTPKQDWLEKNRGIIRRTARELHRSVALVSTVFNHLARSAVVEKKLTKLGAPGFPREEPTRRRSNKKVEL